MSKPSDQRTGLRNISAAQLLAETDELLRTFPTDEQLANDDAASDWRGRTTAVLTAWSVAKGTIELGAIWNQYDNGAWALMAGGTRRRLRALIHEMRYSLLMESGESSSAAIEGGKPFNYFNEISKNVRLATSDAFFVDPYLDAEFATRYLPQLSASVNVRLLTSAKGASALLPAVDLFAKQTGTQVEVRETTFHDRFLFIDRKVGFQSSASFKDGAKKLQQY